jgi:hypothetical protein
MTFEFRAASRQQRKGRIGLIGPSGSGKTYTALELATGFGGRIALIDTENSSSELYADRFAFDVLNLDTFAPQTYVQAIQAAEQAGYDVLIIDSLSHAWMGRDGALEMVDKATVKSRSGNSFAAWREVTPQHNALVDALVRCKSHLIVTMRAKTEYVIEQVQRNGRTVNEPRKIGMAPVQRDGLEYEFDIVADMDWENRFIVSKTRYDELTGEVITKPTRELGAQIAAWLASGEAPKPAPTPKPVTVPSTNGRSNGTSPPPPPPQEQEAPPATVDWTPAQQVAAELGLSKAQANAVWRTLGASVREATTADIERYCEALRQEPQEREVARKAFFASCNEAGIAAETAKLWARKTWEEEAQEIVSSTNDVPSRCLRALAALLRNGKVTAAMVESYTNQPA